MQSDPFKRQSQYSYSANNDAITSALEFSPFPRGATTSMIDIVRTMDRAAGAGFMDANAFPGAAPVPGSQT
jgi:hypothetical protein